MAKIEKTFNGKRFTYLCNGEVYKNSTRDYKYACVATTRQAKGAIPEWHTFIDWIRTLPFAEELIFVGLETEE